MNESCPSLAGLSFLLLEDKPHAAPDIAFTITEAGGTLIGIVADLDEARDLLDGGRRVDGAVLDLDVKRNDRLYQLAQLLQRRNVPFAFVTEHEAPNIAGGYRDIPLLNRPVEQGALITILHRLATKR